MEITEQCCHIQFPAAKFQNFIKVLFTKLVSSHCIHVPINPSDMCANTVPHMGQTVPQNVFCCVNKRPNGMDCRFTFEMLVMLLLKFLTWDLKKNEADKHRLHT